MNGRGMALLRNVVQLGIVVWLGAGCVAKPAPSSDCFPVYTPDGTSIVFVSIPFADGNSEIWMMAADGTHRRQLTRLQGESGKALAAGGFRAENGKGLNLYPAVAPDGGSAAFVSVRRSPTVLTSIVYRIDLATGRLTSVAEVPAQRVGPLAWAPDARSLVFTTDKSGMYELWRVSADGGAPEMLTKNGFHTWSSTWGPARHIVFAGNPKSNGGIGFDPARVGKWDLFLLDPKEGSVEALTRNDDDDFSPAWDPTGTRIAFVSRVGSEWRLNVMDATTRDVRTIFRDTRYLDHPAWSPDGVRIAFTRGRASEFEGYFMDLEIWELALATGALRNLSAGDRSADATSPVGVAP